MIFQSIDEKIEYFSKNILENHLLIVDKIVNGYKEFPPIPDSEKVAFFLLMSYFETIGKYFTGFYGKEKYSVEEYFMMGFEDFLLHPNDKENILLIQFFSFLVRFLYRGGRCNLFHVNSLDYRIVLSNKTDDFIKMEIPLKEEGGTEILKNFELRVNVKILLESVIRNFNHYLEILKKKENPKLLKNFETRFDKDMEGIDTEKLSMKKIMGEMLEKIRE